MKKVLAILLLANITLAGCNTPAPNQPVNNPPKQPSQENVTAPATQTSAESKTKITIADLIKVQPAFADSNKFYKAPSTTPQIKETAGEPSSATNLDSMQKALRTELTKTQLEFLQKNKFLILDNYNDRENFCFNFNLLNKENYPTCRTDITYTPPNPPDFMVALFKTFGGDTTDFLRTPANAVYINSDIILHTYHVFLDRYFKKLEQKQLHPLLISIIEKLQNQTFGELKKADGEAKSSLQRAAGYLTLGKVLLETSAGAKPGYFESPEQETAWLDNDKNIDKTITAFYKNLDSYKKEFEPAYFESIRGELKNILDAKDVALSPMFALYNPKSPTDYTQFTPRSHYNENSVLRSYFRAMMLFGRQTFYFGSTEGMKDAAVLAMLIKDSKVENDWAKLSEVTDFLAGASDDITYKQFKESLAAALGASAKIGDIFASADNLAKIKTEAAKLPNPKILSEVVIDDNMGNLTKEDLLLGSKGLRLFGQKFTFDAWILNQMTAGSEKTEIKLPSTPTALFVAAGMGGDLTKELLPEWIKQNDTSLQSDQIWTKLTGIRTDLDTMKPQEWLGNISSGWLWTLAPLLQTYGEGYPAFMQAPLYRNKNLQTVLGSYTELKHDTLLYAKQSYAELGGGGDEAKKPPEIVKGFVEPDLEFWARIIALSKLTQDGLSSRGLLDEDVGYRMDGFIKNLEFYKDFAVKELTNEKISDEDYETLRTNFWQTADLIAPFNQEVIEEKDKKPALIADIHTDALKSQILYEATGNPLIMLTYVADQGTPRIVIGLTYRHFELTGPLDTRYNDEDWKKRVDDNQLPETPFYYKDLFVK